MPALRMSLHVGINAYPPPTNSLANCVADAGMMREVAESSGFQPMGMLLDGAATSTAVIAAIRVAAAVSEARSTFLFTQSSHGDYWPVAPGVEEAEPDGMTEALCYPDREVSDDELYREFCAFHPESLVIQILDTCFSGGMIRARRDGAAMSSRRAPPSLRTALGPPPIVTRPRGTAPRIISLAACQAYQTAGDGVDNGTFTAALLNVWAPGFSGSWLDLRHECDELMPRDQSPRLTSLRARPLLSFTPFLEFGA